jgi:nucleotide-binding universal stress UspA family protein
VVEDPGQEERAMFEVVVVGTDGSDTAGMAVREAAELVRSRNGTLHVVSSYRPASSRTIEGGGEQWTIMPEDRVDSVLEESAALARILGVNVEVHASKSDPAAAILRVAKEVKADVVVVGNKGMKGAKRFLLGSVPSKVAHDAPCAVLIIKTT